MKIVLRGMVFLGLVMAIGACTGGQTRPDSRKVVKRSAESMPNWTIQKKKSRSDIYFVGIIEKAPDFKAARQKSIDDAVGQLISYIGFRARRTFVHTSTLDTKDEASTLREKVIDSIEGTGEASISVDVDESYFVQYDDGSYDMYVLMKISKSWVVKERNRLAAQTALQRKTINDSLKKIETMVENGSLGAALTEATGALMIAGQAAENSDLFESVKSAIRNIISGLNFKLENSPKYVYSEGGSDSIVVGVYSSQNSKPVSGLMMSAKADGGKATVVSSKGYSTGTDGKVEYSVSRMNDSSKEVKVIVSFSSEKLQAIDALDTDFYKELITLQDKIGLGVELKIMSKDKALPMAVVVMSVLQESKRKYFSKPQILMQEQEKFGGVMANRGYNVVSIEIPGDVLIEAKESKAIKESVMKHILKNYPSAKRMLFGFQVVSVLGSTPHLEGGLSVSLNLTMSIIDLSSGKLEKSISSDANGYGMSVDQAVKMAQKRAFKKVMERSNELD